MSTKQELILLLERTIKQNETILDLENQIKQLQEKRVFKVYLKKHHLN